MACHTLMIRDDGLVGDTLDRKMFEFSGGKMSRFDFGDDSDNFQEKGIFIDFPNNLGQSNSSFSRISIVKTFEFNSDLKRMSVIIKETDHGIEYYSVLMKGSPDDIENLFESSSVPLDYNRKNFYYSQVRILK